jgi:hypothetical protein
MAKGAEHVTSRRVYVTFLHDGTVALHPSKCTGPRFRMMAEGSIHLGKRIPAKELGEAVLWVRDRCLTA